MVAASAVNAWANMQDKLGAMGGVTKVTLGEPKDTSVQAGMVMIIPMSGNVPEVTLTGRRETHQVSLVRLESAIAEPVDMIEERLEQWRAEILDDIDGDFDLGGTIAYALPAETTWEWGHVTYDKMYRFLDITFSFRLDPSTSNFVQ